MPLHLLVNVLDLHVLSLNHNPLLISVYLIHFLLIVVDASKYERLSLILLLRSLLRLRKTRSYQLGLLSSLAGNGYLCRELLVSFCSFVLSDLFPKVDEFA